MMHVFGIGGAGAGAAAEKRSFTVDSVKTA